MVNKVPNRGRPRKATISKETTEDSAAKHGHRSLMNYLALNCDSKDAAKFLREYGKKFDRELPNFPDDLFHMRTLGFFARSLVLGCEVDESSMEWFENKLEDLEEKIAERMRLKEAAAPVKAPENHLNRRVAPYIAEIDEQIDIFSENLESDWKVSQLFEEKPTSKDVLEVLVVKFRPLLQELIEAKTKKDDQLVEAYRNLKPRQLSKYIEFVQSIVDGLELLANVKKVRVKRAKAKVAGAKKKVSPNDMVKGVQWLEKSEEFGLVSRHPSEIPGAKEVWIFYSQPKVVGVYRAEHPEGLTVSGSRIRGFARDKSQGKKVGRIKGRNIAKEMADAGPKNIKNVFDDAPANAFPITGGTNPQMIILKVVK